jgi:hypothetical protein
MLNANISDEIVVNTYCIDTQQHCIDEQENDVDGKKSRKTSIINCGYCFCRHQVVMQRRFCTLVVFIGS